MWILVVIVLAVIALYQYFRARNDIFKRIDIKGPTPTLLLGNLLEINKENGLSHPRESASGELLQQWTKRFGKVYGYYEGGTPVLVTSDPEMLSEIFVKQFSNFHGRKLMEGQTDPDTAKELDMFLARGARWKRLRNISNPTFSSMKMKQMFPIISECVDELILVLDEKCKTSESFNIHKTLQGLTLDVIARTAFGYQTSIQKNPNDKLLQLCRAVLSNERPMFRRVLVFASFVLPEFRNIIFSILRKTARIDNHPAVFITDQMMKVIEERKKQKVSNEGVKDFIQLLLEAETVTEDSGSTSTKTESVENLNLEKRLTTDEIVAQCFLFLIAGYDSTSSALGFVSYLLALHPEIQEKVYEEIKQNISQGQTVSYDNVQKLSYMDAAIHETLRMFPIGQPVLHRRCMNSCTINGVYIPEGINIAADVLSLHFSEENWGPDANEFKPERFLQESAKERKSIIYMPFGAGPRACIGMRFAMLEMKLTLCKLLQKYKIGMCDESQVPIKVNTQSIVRSPEKGVFVKLEKRINSV